jgi:hypothetical protein
VAGEGTLLPGVTANGHSPNGTDESVTAALTPEITRLRPWFHNLHLPGGVQTAPDHPLGDFLAFMWRELAPHLPGDLAGWRVPCAALVGTC